MIKAYHRPESVEAALELLNRQGIATVAVAGGTYINARLDDLVDEVVDLQAVGLDDIQSEGDRLHIGAMVRLQTVVEDTHVPELVRDMAHREGPNTFRNAGTVGGAVACASAESEFLAALLAFEATVTVRTQAGARTLALADLLADASAVLRRSLITSVSLAITGTGASARVARTPADAPIVAAVARRSPDSAVHLALCGVAATPILVAPENVAALQPPADFRGSSAYRRQMAIVLSQRVLAALSSD